MRQQTKDILDHWDMRTGRNRGYRDPVNIVILDHWDMRTGRNEIPFT